jgi:hypothetical protein
MKLGVVTLVVSDDSSNQHQKKETLCLFIGRLFFFQHEYWCNKHIHPIGLSGLPPIPNNSPACSTSHEIHSILALEVWRKTTFISVGAP